MGHLENRKEQRTRNHPNQPRQAASNRSGCHTAEISNKNTKSSKRISNKWNIQRCLRKAKEFKVSRATTMDLTSNRIWLDRVNYQRIWKRKERRKLGRRLTLISWILLLSKIWNRSNPVPARTKAADALCASLRSIGRWMRKARMTVRPISSSILKIYAARPKLIWRQQLAATRRWNWITIWEWVINSINTINFHLARKTKRTTNKN